MIFTAARIDGHESYRIGLCEHLVPEEELEETAHRARGAHRGAAAARDPRGEDAP